MTEIIGDGPEDHSKQDTQSVPRLVRAAAATPVARAIASILLALASLLALAPANDIGQLASSSQLGVRLPSKHGLELTIGIRLALALFALALAFGAVRRLVAQRAGADRTDTENWMTMVAGAAALVSVVAVILDLAAFVDALANAPWYSTIYNHIGS